MVHTIISNKVGAFNVFFLNSEPQNRKVIRVAKQELIIPTCSKYRRRSESRWKLNFTSPFVYDTPLCFLY